MASAQRASDRMLALVLRRSRCAERGQELPARLLYPLLRPGRQNWNYAHAASRGTIARRYPYNYDQGSGTAVTNYEYQGLRVPGEVIDLTETQSSEQPMRNFYRRWAEFMEADDWSRLATWRGSERKAAE